MSAGTSSRPAVLLVVIAAFGCQASLQAAEVTTPALTSISSSALVVGQRLTLGGDGFVDAEQGWVDVTLHGTFVPPDGPSSSVDLTVEMRRDEAGDLVWPRFGGHRVPFGTGDRTGVFHGVVSATNRYFDGRRSPASEPASVTLDVQPSVVITDFRAFGDGWISDCLEPAPVALNRVPYVMRAKAIGFDVARFELAVSEGLDVGDGQPTRGITTIPVDPAGHDDAAAVMQFAPVPENVEGYRMTIDVVAWDTAGYRHSLSYPFVVRRPLQVYFTTDMQIAELYPPQPVTGCIPGGRAGIESQYAESHSETRTREISHSVTSGWEQTYGEQHAQTWGESHSTGGAHEDSHAVSVGQATTEGGSQSTTDMFERTSSRSRAHSVDFASTSSSSWEAGGNGGLNLGVVSLGAEGKHGWVNGSSRGHGRSSTSGSSTTSGRSSTAEQHWERTQTYEEMNGYTDTTTWNDTSDYSEAETESESIATSLGETDSETLSVSTTDTTSLQTSAQIPPGQMAMWYRQTTRLVREGVIVAYDLCGNGSPVGRVMLDDWAWAPDLAVGGSCPTQPDFPVAECRISPCEGQ